MNFFVLGKVFLIDSPIHSMISQTMLCTIVYFSSFKAIFYGSSCLYLVKKKMQWHDRAIYHSMLTVLSSLRLPHPLFPRERAELQKQFDVISKRILESFHSVFRGKCSLSGAIPELNLFCSTKKNEQDQSIT